MLPDFVIIGAQKSASTFVQSCLAEHPDIYMPNGEIPFFETPDYESGDISMVEALFNGRNESCLGIKRPNYLARTEVPTRLMRHLPEAKLIVVLRNPVERALSAYFHLINYGFIPPLDAEVGLPKCFDDCDYLTRFPRASEILEFGFYGKCMQRYLYYLDRGRLLCFLHEDILSDPYAAIRKAYSFLEVDDAYTPVSLSSRPQKVVYNISRLKLLSLRNRFMYEYFDGNSRLRVKRMSPSDYLIAGGITLFDRHIASRLFSNAKPNISTGLKRKMYGYYESDIDQLEKLISRDLASWRL
ncbi:sulfotransferase family protein [Cerasicoccus frondis]|uniref:sulfotransferase family protein n=1 Tax=Cerasicoccus frondis TaxID=490090 RepID=UPI002852AFEB|nr:sulfotransferase [Cerasicoccus frondis]